MKVKVENDTYFYEYDTSKKEECCHVCNNGKIGDTLNIVETKEAGKIGLCCFCFGSIVDQDLEAMLRGMREHAEIEINKLNKQRYMRHNIMPSYWKDEI